LDGLFSRPWRPEFRSSHIDAEAIRIFLNDGENVLLFDTDEEAFTLVTRLKADEALRARIARNARNSVEEMFSARPSTAMTQYFITGESEGLETCGAHTGARTTA
jgi:hypothetical protein